MPSAFAAHMITNSFVNSQLHDCVGIYYMCVFLVCGILFWLLYQHSLSGRTAKIIILGEAAVGKTSLVNRYTIIIINMYLTVHICGSSYPISWDSISNVVWSSVTFQVQACVTQLKSVRAAYSINCALCDKSMKFFT